MPSSREAKVVKINESYLVVVPRDWARYNKIRKGSVLDVEYDGVLVYRMKTDRTSAAED